MVSNSKSRCQMLAAAFICVSSLSLGVMSAQTPLDNAWTILQAGAENKSIDQRVITMRVLQLIPGDAKAVSMAEKGLKDKEAQVRAAAAASLGALGNESAIPELAAVIKSDAEGAVAMAAAKALIQLGDPKGYEVFYTVVTGARKSGESLVDSEEKELTQLLKNPKQMEKMAFEQGMGFVPFGGISLDAFQMIHANKEKAPILKATSIKTLAKDPDPRTGKALLASLSDKHWLVRAAVFDALARRGDAVVLPDLSAGLNDDKAEVKLTAAAAVAHLSTISQIAAK